LAIKTNFPESGQRPDTAKTLNVYLSAGHFQFLIMPAQELRSFFSASSISLSLIERSRL